MQGGVGFFGLLTLIFIVLRLTEVVQWSWVWVLSPIWLIPIFVFVTFIGLVLFQMFKGWKRTSS